MRKTILISIFFLPFFLFAEIKAGVGAADITPPVGTPSAGYLDRKGEGMEGVHDTLQALALFIDNGEKKLAICSVDHLGFTYEMVQKVKDIVEKKLPSCEIYIASSHTHSGGGAYLNIPGLGDALAGPYNDSVTRFYIEQTAAAILQAGQNVFSAKMGIGYGKAEKLSLYRGQWPLAVSLPDMITVIKITHLDGAPLAILVNYPVHPTILKSQNHLFSSDFVGYMRDYLISLLGSSVKPLYINGAQGDIVTD